ncbi:MULTISPECIES: PucR family transcriptional regulator [unclassified Leucobacter]|uniref:PucR family transcriptional regulator n=1 Tax=unclassified Leucobacter TaxID=2621730 RepID=UPI00165DB0A6|nr:MULTISPECIES: PucR family transcriptional regulator [unclassified Leucobacter]MBC9936509.1 PucR family transcriptional regulator [Leucobacter sp. cx-87]
MIDLDKHAPLPTVREVLALPEFAAGEPTLIAGGTGLDAPVRWAHVAAGEGVASLLDGGELILTTGAGWPQDPAARAALFAGLLDAGVAAIVLEISRHLDAAPDLLVEACEERGVPLIVLAREVRFVQITQRVHRLILAGQSEALQARATVHAMLTELGLNRSPVDYVIERLAEAIGAPVVLENSAHDVIAWSSPSLGDDPEEVLAAWAPRPAGGVLLPEGWEQVPVEARGTRWGALTALPGPAHPAGRRTVLELGAFALALGRLADTDADQWVRFSSKQLVERLLAGRYRRDTELAVQLAAGGLPVEDRTLVGVTLRGTGDFGSHGSLERAVLETALRRSIAPEGRAIIAADDGVEGSDAGADSAGSGQVLLALLSFPLGDPRIDPAADQGAAPPLASRLARELEMLVPTTVPAGWRAHLAIGIPDRGVRGLVTSLERVRAAGRLEAAARVGRVTVQQAARQPLAYLVRGFSGSPELQEFVTETLGPVLDYDRTRAGDLVRVLAAYTEHPTNRSLAAQQSRLSRSVFYQRLALIEDLLGVDLADGTTIATLTVALIAAKER